MANTMTRWEPFTEPAEMRSRFERLFGDLAEEEKEEKDERFIRRERRTGAFGRSIPLPDGVDPNSIEAKTHDGVLEVRVPLPDEGPQEPVKITAQAGD